MSIYFDKDSMLNIEQRNEEEGLLWAEDVYIAREEERKKWMNAIEDEDDHSPDLTLPPPNQQLYLSRMADSDPDSVQKNFILSAFQKLTNSERNAILEMPLEDVVNGLKYLGSKKQDM